MQGPGEAFNLVEVPAPNEYHLQELVKANPQLVPSDDLGLDGELLVVGRETTLASGSIDPLCLARSGDLVLIEFKTGPQNPDFRHALAQVLDYGSDLWRLTREDFDKGVVQRYLRGPHVVPQFATASSLADAISLTEWALTDEDRTGLDERLVAVLQNGDFIYVVAAQRFTAAMVTTLEYLNATMRFGRFYLVEVIQLQGGNLTAHAAQVVAKPHGKVDATSAESALHASEVDLLQAVSDVKYRQALEQLFSSCTAMGLAVQWGAKGASVRIKTPDRNEPLSVGWIMPEGSGWFGARHASFGVDEASLATTPTVEGPVHDFVSAIARIPGAAPVMSKLNAFTFGPADAPGAMQDITAALESLVTAVQRSV